MIHFVTLKRGYIVRIMNKFTIAFKFVKFVIFFKMIFSYGMSDRGHKG